MTYCRCGYCGKPIDDDSVYCPFCGKSQSVFCSKCGNKIESDSSYCPFCGSSLGIHKKREIISSNRKLKKIPRINVRHFITSRFFLLYILWLFVNTLLLCKSDTAYSDYFNRTNVSRGHKGSDNKIYPEDWLYPFKNIFNGIKEQDPVYVYDISEFILYTIIIPILLLMFIYNRAKIFKTERSYSIFIGLLWYIYLWMLIVFPMGLLGSDLLSWSFMMGGVIIGIYSYKKTFAKLYGKY